MQAAGEREWAYLALLASAFAMGFSMPAGRLLLALAALLLGADVARGRRRLRMPWSAWCWLAFVALATVVTCNGLNPAAGVGKLDKLTWYIGIPVAATLVDTRQRLEQMLRALLLGCGVLALRVVLGNPLAALAASRGWGEAAVATPPSFGRALIDRGRLIDGQRLMVGLLGAVALQLGARRRADAAAEAAALVRRCWPPLIALLALAELLSLKRGSWLCTLALLALLLWRRLSWRQLLAGGVLLAAVAVGVTPVRQRLLDLRREFSRDSGGRMTMWTRIAPQLVREHPWGIGFRSLTNDIMRDTARRVNCRRLERQRDHMHSNLVETVVSVGWAGLALYLLWMAAMLRDAAATEGPPRALLWMLAAILLNGLVEYNFADAELVIILGLLGGLAAAGRKLAAGCGRPRQSA